MRQLPLTFLRGFCMGAADIVPGVSGGTVALVFGIYRRLIDAIRSGSSALGCFLKLDATAGMAHLRSVEWSFLIPLLIGIGAAVLALSHLIETLLTDHAEAMAGLFTGLVAGSVVVAWHLLRERSARTGTILVVAAVVTFVLMGLRGGTSEDAVSQVTDPAMWAYFGAGAIAVCAMILPGVSGSFLLVTMGMYGAILSAVNDRDLTAVALVALGCVVGLALFSQVLHWALENHYDTVMAVLIGLMVGSLRVLWPWPDGVDSTVLGGPEGPIAVPVVLAIVGVVVVVSIDLIGRRLEDRTVEDEVEDLHA